PPAIAPAWPLSSAVGGALAIRRGTPGFRRRDSRPKSRSTSKIETGWGWLDHGIDGPPHLAIRPTKDRTFGRTSPSSVRSLTLAIGYDTRWIVPMFAGVPRRPPVSQFPARFDRRRGQHSDAPVSLLQSKRLLLR